LEVAQAAEGSQRLTRMQYRLRTLLIVLALGSALAFLTVCIAIAIQYESVVNRHLEIDAGADPEITAAELEPFMEP
jgi:hypothetical protein